MLLFIPNGVSTVYSISLLHGLYSITSRRHNNFFSMRHKLQPAIFFQIASFALFRIHFQCPALTDYTVSVMTNIVDNLDDQMNH